MKMLDMIAVEEKNGVQKIAGFENGELRELFFYNSSSINEGDIYLGRIVKKITTAQGKKSYFVDVGKTEVFINAQEQGLEDLEANEGQDIILQIAQEARAEKNAKGVRFLQLVGDSVVFCPYGEGVEISGKIVDGEKRQSLREFMETNVGDEGGWIVRTYATEATGDSIISEIAKLKKLFADILGEAKNAKAPAALYLRGSFLGDIINRNIAGLRNIVVNNHLLEQKLADLGIVEYNADVFEEYGVDEQIAEALQKEVKLKSGGRLFIEETKALTAIDVDSGGISGQGNRTYLNDEAAKEIVKQIILRNLSGKIVVDFAGFADFNFLKSSIDILRNGLRDDPVKSRVLGLTKGGSVEILRNRRHPSLSDVLMGECECCMGLGKVAK